MSQVLTLNYSIETQHLVILSYELNNTEISSFESDLATFMSINKLNRSQSNLPRVKANINLETISNKNILGNFYINSKSL